VPSLLDSGEGCCFAFLGGFGGGFRHGLLLPVAFVRLCSAVFPHTSPLRHGVRLFSLGATYRNGMALSGPQPRSRPRRPHTRVLLFLCSYGFFWPVKRWLCPFPGVLGCFFPEPRCFDRVFFCFLRSFGFFLDVAPPPSTLASPLSPPPPEWTSPSCAPPRGGLEREGSRMLV